MAAKRSERTNKIMQRYPKYEPVQFDYVRELPADWQLLPNIAIFDERVERGHPNAELLAVTISKGIIKQTELEHKKDISNEDKSHYKFVQCGDLAYNKMRMWQGAVGYSQYQGIVSPAYVVLSPKVDLNPRFFHYLFRTGFYANYSKRFSYGICDDQLSLRSKDFKRMYAIVPPLEAQDAIVAYLDRKSERANDFIAKQTRLIEVLKEQKQAVINQAVTKGLNPDAPLKESRIEWLGKIPAHWEVRKLKYAGKIKYGLGQPPQEKPDGLPLIRATNVERGKIVKTDMIFVDPDDVPYERDPVLKENDIIVVRSGAYTADSAIIPKEYAGAITGYDMIFRSSKKNNPKFIAFCLLADFLLNKQLLPHSIRAAQPHLNREELGNSFILLPSFEEQKKLVEFIENEIKQIDHAITKAEKQIALARDYLHSLTFQVVTGQRAVPSATIAQRT